MALIDRFVGTCPVCEGIFKVHGQRMVLHGYQRPGHGYIEGQCPGVDYPAYQISSEGCEMWRDQTQKRAARIEQRLARTIANNEPISREENEYHWEGHRQVRKLVMVTYRVGDEKYQQMKRLLVHDIESELRYATDEVKRMQRLIDNWEPRKLPTIKEEEERIQRDVQGQRDAKRIAREQKEAAKLERAEQASRNLVAAREKAVVDHDKNFKKLEAALPLLTERVMTYAATQPGLYNHRTLLDSMTHMIKTASAPPEAWVDSVGDLKWWAKVPLEAAAEIRKLAAQCEAHEGVERYYAKR